MARTWRRYIDQPKIPARNTYSFAEPTPTDKVASLSLKSPTITPPAQPTSESSASRDAVFNTVELMENILSYLSLKDLYRCQRVCRYFRNTIRNYPALCLRSSTTSRQTWTFEFSQTPPSYTYHSSRMRTLPPGEKAPEYEQFPRTTFTPARLCPLLQRIRWAHQSYPRQRNSAMRLWRLQGEKLQLNLEPLESMTDPFQTPRSWEDMYVCDPPAFSATVELHFSLSRKDPGPGAWLMAQMHVKKHVQNPDGLNMRDLLRLDKDVSEWKIDTKTYDRIIDPVRTVKRIEKQYKAKMFLDWDDYRSFVVLEGMVFPTADEWRKVR